MPPTAAAQRDGTGVRDSDGADAGAGAGLMRRAAADAAEAIRRIDELLRHRRTAEAERLCNELVSAEPARVEPWLLQARVRQQRQDFPGMLASAQKAADVAPQSSLARFTVVEAQLHCGLTQEALRSLDELARTAGRDLAALQRLVEFNTHCGRHAQAHESAIAALALHPRETSMLFAASSSALALGRIDEAEAHLDALIAIDPADGDAYYNRSTLSTQTARSNHIEELRVLLAGPNARRVEVPGNYALAKELEDLGEYSASFQALQRGATARRRQLSYDVSSDENAIAQIISTFDAAWLARPAGGHDVEGPIFIVGLPRSGTTLVERILASHSLVSSAGEINDLALAVTRAAASSSKEQMIRRAADADLTTLGSTYWQSVRGHGFDSRFVIDKTPLNYLYLGLIHRALPRALIVHVRRHPLASCFAMYKTLFRMAYPFSYDFADLARYYGAYHRLMEHWRTSLTGRLLEIDYESLVDDPEGWSRRLVEFCGLEWEAQCLRFHELKAPSATASAAQVRRPLYRDARDHWRRYETELAPLQSLLERAGVKLP